MAPTGTGNVLNIRVTDVGTGGQTVNLTALSNGTPDTITFVTPTGVTAVNSNLSTDNIVFTGVATGASVGIIGAAGVTTGTVAAIYAAAATAATLNVSGGETAGCVTINGAGSCGDHHRRHGCRRYFRLDHSEHHN